MDIEFDMKIRFNILYAKLHIYEDNEDKTLISVSNQIVVFSIKYRNSSFYDSMGCQEFYNYGRRYSKTFTSFRSISISKNKHLKKRYFKLQNSISYLRMSIDSSKNISTWKQEKTMIGS